MVQAQQRTPVRGPTFIRLLARLADIDVTPSRQSLPDRLSQWLDWNHALALATALDARPAVGDAGAPASDGLEDECTRARGALVESIKADPMLAVAGASVSKVAANELASSNKLPDYTAFRQCYLVRQHAMQAAAGRLRGRLRDALAQTSPDMAHLADVDAVMEVALTPREHGLLAKVPDLLGRRFERLRETGDASRSWLDTFRRDMQGVLLAELDVRFQPVEGLLAALRAH